MSTEELVRQNAAFSCRELVKTVEDMEEFKNEIMVLETAIESIVFDEDTSDESMMVLERSLTIFMDKVFTLYDHNPKSKFLNTLQLRVDSLLNNVRDILTQK